MDKELLKKAKLHLDKTKIKLMTDAKNTFYASILFQLKIEWDESVGMLAVNPSKLIIAPTYWINRPIEGCIHDLLHEIMHIVLNHISRANVIAKVNYKRYNYAADIVINNLLIESGNALDNTFVVERQHSGKSTEEVYKLIPEPPEDYEPDINKSEEGSDATKDEEKIKQLLSTAKVQAEMVNQWGNMDARIKRLVNELLVPVLPWEELLKNFFTEKAKEDYSWKRPSRRSQDIYMPSLYSEAFGEIAIYCDCSGSIGEKEYVEFLTEINSIISILSPSKTILTNWGTYLGKPKEIPPEANLLDVAALEMLGGTNCINVINDINKLKPVVSVILTDGYFDKSLPKCDLDIIWVIVDNPRFKSNIGEIVHYRPNK